MSPPTPRVEAQLLNENAGNDIFTAKLDPNGTFLWVNGMHGPSNDKLYALDYNSLNDELVVTGYFEDTLNVNGTEY